MLAVTFFLYTLAGSLLTLLEATALVVVHYQFSGPAGADLLDPRADPGAGGSWRLAGVAGRPRRGAARRS